MGRARGKRRRMGRRGSEGMRVDSEGRKPMGRSQRSTTGNDAERAAHSIEQMTGFMTTDSIRRTDG